MALSPIDRDLLQECLAGKPGSWEAFVDRFLGLVVHVVHFTADSRAYRLASADMEDLVADVFLAILDNDLAVLRRFRGESSLATYLTVISRRVVVRELLGRRTIGTADSEVQDVADPQASAEERISNKDQVETLLHELTADEANIVRKFHLEGKTYNEISGETGVPENTIGPVLSRARARLRRVGLDRAAH